jgi:hypothetical protein
VRRRPFFYGWIVLAAAIAMVTVGVGITFSLAVFLKPLEEEFGWSRTLISGIALVNCPLGSYWSLHLSSTLVGASAVTLALALRPPRRVPALAGGR